MLTLMAELTRAVQPGIVVILASAGAAPRGWAGRRAMPSALDRVASENRGPCKLARAGRWVRRASVVTQISFHIAARWGMEAATAYRGRHDSGATQDLTARSSSGLSIVKDSSAQSRDAVRQRNRQAELTWRAAVTCGWTATSFDRS